MGCCGKSRPRVRKQKVIKPRKSVVRAQTRVPMKPISEVKALIKRACPRCGWPMSSSVRKYDPITKKAKVIWACTNRQKCKYTMER
jgi:ssDNA-binding Zn-finger/Zn-ribbon topoisomerase 1